MIFLDLPETIRKMRKRRGENQAEFAALLGIKQNTVSAYESGKTEPSRAVFFNLQRLAETDEEKRIFAAWLAADQPPAPDEANENLIFQIRQSAQMGVVTFAEALGVSQIEVASWESGGAVPSPPIVRKLQALATKYKRADLALMLGSDDWKIQAIFHPGETFISTVNRVDSRSKSKDNRGHRPTTEREQAHRLLDEIYDSGADVAIDLVFRQLVVSGDYVRGLRKPHGKKHVG